MTAGPRTSRSRPRGRVAAALSVLAAAGSAFAAPGGTLAQPVDAHGALENLALARARSEMYRNICGLALDEGLSIGRWSGRRVDLDRGLRLWVRSRPPSAAARHYSDGVCEVDLRIEPGELLGIVARLERDVPASGAPALPERTLRAAAARWPILWTTGTARPAPLGASHKPRGWEDVSPEGIELAKRAAAADALALLLEQAGAMKVTAAKRLSEFLASSDEVRREAAAAIERAATVRVEAALDQVAVADATLRVGDLIRALSEIHERRRRGEALSGADFREMALLAETDRLESVGLAAPPESTRLPDPYPLIEPDAPAWRDRTLSATGRYAAREGGEEPGEPSSEAKLAVARFEALDALRREVEALTVGENLTLQTLFGYRQDLRDDVALLLSSARVVRVSDQAAPDDARLEVRVELPLRRLWEIVRRAATVEVLDPPSTQPTEREGTP